jgi:rSAM/selenodomain-associated transferase 1
MRGGRQGTKLPYGIRLLRNRRRKALLRPLARNGLEPWRGDRMKRICLCIFAKAPRPGEVKTRLAQTIGDTAAAELARFFVADLWTKIAALPWARPVLATTAGADWGLGAGVELWQQGEGEPGDRLERILVRGLEEEGAAIAIVGDCPGLPVAGLEQARAGLEEAEAVLGPCGDGGFHLIGLRRCPPGFLSRLPWGDETVFEHLRARCLAHGMRVRVLEPCDDVDHFEDLERLAEQIARGEADAPRTARLLRELRLWSPSKALEVPQE